MREESDSLTRDESTSNDFTQTSSGSEASSSPQTSAAGAAAAPAKIESPDEESTRLNFSRVINDRISMHHPRATLMYQEEKITVTGLRRDGILGKNVEGSDVLVPYSWLYLGDLFSQLV
jgi:hypothetical protein